MTMMVRTALPPPADDSTRGTRGTEDLARLRARADEIARAEEAERAAKREREKAASSAATSEIEAVIAEARGLRWYYDQQVRQHDARTREHDARARTLEEQTWGCERRARKARHDTVATMATHGLLTACAVAAAVVVAGPLGAAATTVIGAGLAHWSRA